MLQRNTVILLVLFAIVLAVAVLIQRQEPEDTPEGSLPTPVPSRFLLELDPNQVDSLRVSGASGEAVAFEKKNDLWLAVEPPAPAENVDQTQLTSTISQLSAIRVLNELENPPALDAIGLDVPDYAITFSMPEEGEQKIEIGDESPVGNGYYIRLNRGSPKLVDKFVLDRFIAFLETPPIIPTPTITPTLSITSTLTVTPESELTPAPSP